MILRLPPPFQEPPGGDRSQGPHSGESPGDDHDHHRRRPNIPSVDELLEMFVQLTGAVMTGVVSNAQASIVHRNLRTILDVQLRRAGGGAQAFDHTAVVELCRTHPEALRVLEPFLTDDQVAWLLSEINRADDP